MVERICPACQHGNPLDDRFCGKCGVPLERQLPMRRPGAHLTIAGRELPVTWKQFSRTVALSVAALAAEAGLTWLRRRMEAGPSAAPIVHAGNTPQPRPEAVETTALAGPVRNVVTIVSQRVVEVWDGGEGTRRVVESNFWRRTEE
ncbi:MAG TPA: zinc ribbon domain-containing protein [Roseiflexaceae bacterium]|nr:zinc ribbon domain-containing protein [Roseiflexaceae bacterium]